MKAHPEGFEPTTPGSEGQGTVGLSNMGRYWSARTGPHFRQMQPADCPSGPSWSTPFHAMILRATCQKLAELRLQRAAAPQHRVVRSHRIPSFAARRGDKQPLEDDMLVQA